MFLDRFYPVLNPMTNMKDEYFDACSYNYFNREVMKEIIIKIKNMKINDTKVKGFLTRLIVILEAKMEIGYYTVIEGNQ